MKDSTGYEIPPALVEEYKYAQAKARDLLARLDAVIATVAYGVEKNELHYREIGEDTVIDLRNARRSLERLRPFAVCTSCQGLTKENCTLCRQKGYISRFLYENCVPIETKEIRSRAIELKRTKASTASSRI